MAVAGFPSKVSSIPKRLLEKNLSVELLQRRHGGTDDRRNIATVGTPRRTGLGHSWESLGKTFTTQPFSRRQRSKSGM